MTQFNQGEWINFRRGLNKRPWLWFCYGLQIATLVYRRLATVVQLRFARAPHQGIKQWPSWLGDRRLDLSHSRAIFQFPAYTTRFEAIEAVSCQFAARENDPEYYLALNRWGNCIFAMVNGGGALQGALHSAMNWIVDAPAKSDSAWETYSSCERVVNLAVLLAAHPQLQSAADSELQRGFFVDSLNWIHSHLEYYGMRRTNNHLLNNGRAMVVLGSVLGCSAAVERGLAIVVHMSQELFQPQGFLRERSSHYQVIVTNWLLDTVHFARNAENKNAETCRLLLELEKLTKLVAGATHLLVSHLGYRNSQIGDISPDIHPQLSVARMYGLYSNSFIDLCVTEMASLDDWVFMSNPNGGRDSVVLCGVPTRYPLAYTTHGHGDFCSFVWIHDGAPVLVDAGRSTYLPGQTSDFQCGAKGHNSLSINGLPPLAESIFKSGRWFPEPYSCAYTFTGVTTEGGIILKHDGFSRVYGVGMHVRTCQFENGELVVEDAIDGSASVEVEMMWHFPPEFAPQNGTVVSDGKNKISISSLTAEGKSPDVDWQTYPYSIYYGDERSAPMQTFKWVVTLPCRIRTIFKVTACAV